MCLYPMTMPLPREEWTDSRNTRVVPCGKCVKCKKRRANGWTFRLEQEQKRSCSSAFITLTYEKTPVSKNGFDTLKKKDFQDFMKRLRKFISDKYIELGYKSKDEIPKLRYYMCGEYGGKTKRPHYHAIMFNLPSQCIHDLQIITSKWSHGYCYIAETNVKTIAYVTGYVMKSLPSDLSLVDKETGEILIEDDRIPEYSAMSKNLGLNYLSNEIIKYYRERMLGVIIRESGHMMAMPRYYKERIFSPAERRTIAYEFEQMHKLDLEKLTEEQHIRMTLDKIAQITAIERQAVKREKQRIKI